LIQGKKFLIHKIIRKMIRTQFYFKDIYEIPEYNKRFTALAYFFNRLISIEHDDDKLKLVNIEFSTKRTYETYTSELANHVERKFNFLNYYAIWDKDSFEKLNFEEQLIFIWEKAHQNLKEACLQIKNESLLKAIERVYHNGLLLNLNLNYYYMTTLIHFQQQEVKAGIFVKCKKDIIEYSFQIEKDETILWNIPLWEGNGAALIFLYAFKKIEVDSKNRIVIKGLNNVIDIKFPIRIEVNNEGIPETCRKTAATE
jgi:hypothetical protein